MKPLAIVVLVIALAACGHGHAPNDPGRPPGKRADAVNQDANPWALVAAAWATDPILLDPKSTPQQKAKARKVRFDIAYRYLRASDLSPTGAVKYARAFAEDSTFPEPVCGDYVTPPAGCKAFVAPRGLSIP
jgi:hypothetical protein